MKVVHVPRRFVQKEWGGTETTILQMCKAMIAAGHKALIHTSLALSDNRREQLFGVELIRHRYIYPFFGLSKEEKLTMDKKGGNLLSLELLWALLSEKDVDVFHAHTGKRVGAVVRTAARLRKLPYVITLHGGVFDVPAKESQQMLAPIRNKFEWGRIFGALLGARRVLEDADAIICVGENEWRAAQKALPGKRVEYMPNGVDSAFFAKGDGERFRRTQGIAGDQKVILCLSRIDYQKNQLALIEALPDLLKFDQKIHLLMVGPVTVPAYKQQLIEAIERLSLSEHVTLLPGIRFGDRSLCDAYHAADIFCLPSLHEPFGIVILEAWAAGLPVLAAKVGGIPSFTCDGEDVLLFDPSDKQQLVERIMQLLSDTRLATSIATNGLKKAREEYDWAVITQRVVAIYQELIKGNSR